MLLLLKDKYNIENNIKANVIIFYKMKNTNTDKEMAELYYHLYSGCMKLKAEKNKYSYYSVNCDTLYKECEKYSIKYIDSKEKKIDK